MNEQIREKIRETGVKQWQVAKRLGVSESTLIRWLRDDLSQERKTAILNAIEEVRGS